jgi:hypothetical protein
MLLYRTSNILPKEHASLLWPSGSMEPVIPTLAICSLQFVLNRIGGIMVSVLALSAVDHGFEPQASSLRQQSAGRHVALLGQIILIPSQQVFDLFP